MKENWKEALAHTFSQEFDKNIITTKHGKLEFYTHQDWVEPIYYPNKSWGYHTKRGWKKVKSFSLFPPMTDGFQESEWFDPYKYSELLYIKLLRVVEFMTDNKGEEYPLTKPVIVEDNDVYFQVMNLNTKWSTYATKWTFDPEFTIFINGMVYPVHISTTGLVEIMKTQKLIEIGNKITPTKPIELEGLLVKI